MNLARGETLVGCKVILVRHAQAKMAGRFCGQSDPPLDEMGRKQLRELANTLRPYPMTQVFSSDLRRARQTAEPIAQMTNLEVHFLPALREIGFGRWEGLNWPEITLRDAAYAQRWVDSFPRLPAPEGEPFDDFRRRIREAMDAIANRVGNGCAVAITHGGVIRTFLWEALHLTASRYRSLNCDYASCWEVQRNGDGWSGTLP